MSRLLTWSTNAFPPGVVLARRHFADPLTAVPGAIASVFHSGIGSLLAGWWRWRDRPRE